MRASNIFPANEDRRLAALRRYEILDTPKDGAFDDVTRIAARLFRVPIAIVSLVDHDRIWFKSHHGIDVNAIGRDPGLCASAILGDEAWILTEAHTDPRALANPLVAGEFGLKFYAGVPLRTHDGFNLGTLCVIDREPREVTLDEIATLSDLAAVVMEQMELRLAARRALERVSIVQREVDHRLISNLNSLSLMLGMERDRAVNTAAFEHLNDAANRIMAIADLHRAFLTVGDGKDWALPADRIGGLSYVRRLCADMARMLGISIDVGGTEIILHPLQAQAIGLLFHELASNAAKHGGHTARIEIGPEGDGRYRISVVDDGPGLPVNFNPERSARVGLSVILATVDQLEGEYRFDTGDGGQGTRFTLSFPATLAGAVTQGGQRRATSS